jgi:hypothetical protein
MKPMVLHPFDPTEAISVTAAAIRADKSDRTIRNWCLERHIGRRIAGQWAVSAVALDMLLAGDDDGLQAYLAGDRASDHVVAYYRERSIPLRPPARERSIDTRRVHEFTSAQAQPAF